jgi:predicted nucleotide-binding protein (sugar kinase/HSP70/actin superfamily)
MHYSYLSVNLGYSSLRQKLNETILPRIRGTIYAILFTNYSEIIQSLTNKNALYDENKINITVLPTGKKKIKRSSSRKTTQILLNELPIHNLSMNFLHKLHYTGNVLWAGNEMGIYKAV